MSVRAVAENWLLEQPKPEPGKGTGFMDVLIIRNVCLPGILNKKHVRESIRKGYFCAEKCHRAQIYKSA